MICTPHQTLCSTNYIISLVGYVAHTKSVLVRNQKKREHLKDLGVDRSIILKWIFKKYNSVRGLD
jgi:hypothetical protein